VPPSAARRAARVSDVERITARTALRQVRPRELAGLRDTLLGLPALRAWCPAAAPLLDAARRTAPDPAIARAAAAGLPPSRRCCCATAA
jgi:DNA mismatch repair protein MutS